MNIFRTVLLAALLQVFWGAEFWPDVPDPIGLGPRLALIDWLRERQVKIPHDATDIQLVEAWRQASGVAAKEDEQKRAAHDEQVAADRARRDALDLARSKAAVEEAVASVPETPGQEPPLAPEAAAPAPAPAPQASPAPRPTGRARAQPAPATPEPHIGNLREWAENWAAPSSSTRTGTTVSLYIRRGNTTHYYLITEQSASIVTAYQKKQAAARIIIDGEDYGLANPGLAIVKAKAFRTSPQLSLVAP